MSPDQSTNKPIRAGQRPISPHLGIYRFAWPMLYSIMHRLTGIAIVAVIIWITIWLLVFRYAPFWFESMLAVQQSWFASVALLFLVWALCYHFCAGIRHLLWDLELGFTPIIARISGHLCLASSLVMTVIFGYLIL